MTAYVSDEFLMLGPAQCGPLRRPSLVVCDRCGASDFHDAPIHDGRSVRRDCRCGRFMGWPVWYGEAAE